MRTLSTFLFCALSWPLWSCSALVFTGKTTPLVAVNLDWPIREVGLIVVHPRHQPMTAQVNTEAYHPLTWSSRHGSVIFHSSGSTPHSIGPSIDGMNEKGLTASILVLNDTQYEINETKPALNISLWVRYVLDNFESVQEVIEHANTYQLLAETYHNRLVKFHMLIHDKEGHHAILEYLQGKLVIHQDDAMPVAVLTNNEYTSSLNSLPQYHPFGGALPLPGEYNSSARFVRAAATLKRLPVPIPEEEQLACAFNALGEVAQPLGTHSVTQVSMVFDITHLKIYFRTINEARIRYIALTEIDFDQLEKDIQIDGYQHQSGNILKQANVSKESHA